MSAITIHIALAWWVKPYIYACLWFAWTFGMVPDEAKIARTVSRGITWTVQ